MPDGIPAVCKDQEGTFCLDKGDGYWCNGNLLTLCEVGKIGSSIACSNGCQSMQDGVDDQCKSNNPGTPDGDLLSVSKQGQCGVFSGTIDLWAGTGLSAWNQKDHDKDTIGTCDGLTIKSSGCLITSLAMLYEYLEKYRTVNGKTGNSPPMEDDWRTKKVNGATRGYAATTYTVDGAEKSGNCMAYLSTNPSGVSLQYHYNTAAGCIEYQAAVSIANSLNSGLPVVAGVHWISGKEDQHWVLVTGADADGVFFNDPWGGAKNVRPANGKLGSYTIDTFFTPYMAGIGGPDEDGTAFGENGQPLALDLATSRLPTILEESSDTEPTPDGDDVVGPADASPEIISEQPKTKSGGCAHGTGNPTGAMLVLILLLALACRRTAKEY